MSSANHPGNTSIYMCVFCIHIEISVHTYIQTYMHGDMCMSTHSTYQCHHEVYLRYLMLWLQSEHGTMKFAIIEAAYSTRDFKHSEWTDSKGLSSTLTLSLWKYP